MYYDFHHGTKAIAGYTLEKELGTGLFGTCYLCKNQLGKPVILKQYKAEAFQINPKKNHYEASTLSTLTYPAIPRLFGILHTRTSMYLLLEYMPGNTLAKNLFYFQKTFNNSDIFRIGLQLLSVIDYLHMRNIVHRDISIDNIIDDGVQISLVDFGMSRSIRYEEPGAWLDYYCFGEVLLFLLYSRFTRNNGQSTASTPWYEELKLPSYHKEFINRLLNKEKPFMNVAEITFHFTKFMKSLPRFI
ncbi:protein kinase [Lacrimispora sp.]|uniref:protein kinase domain-containing protein n=1 Tax=Lacrimispora sp. TaxID=2719234 RepID=UPI003460605C